MQNIKKWLAKPLSEKLRKRLITIYWIIVAITTGIASYVFAIDAYYSEDINKQSTFAITWLSGAMGCISLLLIFTALFTYIGDKFKSKD